MALNCRLVEMMPLPEFQKKLMILIEPVSLGMDWLVKLTLRSAQPSVLSGVKRMLGFGYIFTDLTTESLQPLMEVIRSVVR